MDKINTDKKTLIKFSMTMFIALSLIATLLLIKHKNSCLWLYGISALFLLSGKFYITLLRPVYIVWMRFAFILSWINTRIILLLMFYVVFTPIGFLMRLFGADPLSLKIEKNKDSYWIENKKESNYERQF